MPQNYPVDDSSTLVVDASISSSDGGLWRKLALNRLPDLLKVCRSVALEHAGEESVFVVFSRADEWVDTEWQEFVTKNRTCTESSNKVESVPSQKTQVLARKVIYSHHIIAKTKRRAIADLSRDYQLGGFAKIGWPGIIIIEGEEGNCDKFIDEIRGMRWQHLVVRGEELTPVPAISLKTLDELRVLPPTVKELGEDKMSILAEKCRDAGLEDLFKTSMKMYTTKGDKEIDCDKKERIRKDQWYGAMVHVDHMNNRKAYEKWLLKACKSAGCIILLRRCYKNDNKSLRPAIFVCLLGEEIAIKQVLKRWRTSRVDVDSKGNPCLERMMSVIAEGNVTESSEVPERYKTLDGTNSDIHMEDAEFFFENIGGIVWKQTFVNSMA